MTIKPKSFVTKMFASTLFGGLDELDKEAEPYIPQEVKDAVEASPFSDEFKNFLLPIAERGVHSPIGAIAMMALGMGLGSAVGMATPFMRLGSYWMDRFAKSARLDPALVSQLWLRGFPDEDRKEAWWSQLTDQGYDDEQIAGIQKLAFPLPSIADFIFFARRDIFDEDVVSFYDYDGNYPKEMEADVAKAGISPERWKYHWRAHWRDIEWGIANLLLHRGQISPEEHKMILRTANYPPGILDKMLESSWDLPNRIEMRMMTRYLDLDKSFVVDMLGKVGLKEEYRSDAADFMLVMGLRTDISTRYSKGWIGPKEVEEEIAAKGLSAPIAEKLYKWIVKNIQPERVEEARTLTRALIMKGGKLFHDTKGEQGLTRDETIDLLMRHQNYALPEAQYIFDVTEAGWGSPESPMEFRKLVEEGRMAAGEEYIEIPPEVLEVEREARSVALRLSQAISKEAPQEELDELAVLDAGAKARYGEVRALHNL